MNYQTAEQLTALRLRAMRLEYVRQSELPATEDLPFDERFSMIVTACILRPPTVADAVASGRDALAERSAGGTIFAG